MRKYLTLLDGTKYELSPIDMEEFRLAIKFKGDLEEAYDDFLRTNGYQELINISQSDMKAAKLTLDKGEPDINKKVYGERK